MSPVAGCISSNHLYLCIILLQCVMCIIISRYPTGSLRHSQSHNSNLLLSLSLSSLYNNCARSNCCKNLGQVGALTFTVIQIIQYKLSSLCYFLIKINEWLGPLSELKLSEPKKIFVCSLQTNHWSGVSNSAIPSVTW